MLKDVYPIPETYFIGNTASDEDNVVWGNSCNLYEFVVIGLALLKIINIHL